MAFTARHYNEVARIIQSQQQAIHNGRGTVNPDYLTGAKVTVDTIQGQLCRMFAADNPKFDGTRFDMNCEPKEPSK